MSTDTLRLDKNGFKSIGDLPESLEKSLKRIIESEGYKFYDVKIRKINSGGQNFLGDIFEIDIIGETAGGEKEINLFVKKKLHVENIFYMSLSYLYFKESFFYKELAEIFTLLQDEANVPLHDRIKHAKAYSETSTDTIILENLSMKGFKIYDRMETLPLKCVQLAIKEMAKFHGLSFVIENKMPHFFNKNIKVLEHPMRLNEAKEWECLIRNVIQYVANLFQGATKAKVENYKSVFFDKFNKYRNDKTSIKCTLSHGDFRSTNILVRKNDGEPEEVVIVDYQFMDYGCPIRDISYILCANTDQELRRNHMDDIKELYFGTLSRFLSYFEMDVETVYPRTEFEKVFSERLDYGLMMTFCSMPALYAPDTGLDFAMEKLSEIHLSLDENIQDRVRKLIQDFVDWGYIK